MRFFGYYLKRDYNRNSLPLVHVLGLAGLKSIAVHTFLVHKRTISHNTDSHTNCHCSLASSA